MTESRYVQSMICLVGLCLAVGVVGPRAGRSQDTASDSIDATQRIPERQLAQKKEGRSIIALPGPGYSPDLGFIVAALAGYYQNGTRDDPYFAYAPYEYAATLLFSWSTKGMYSVVADWDMPYVRNTPYRIRARFSYQRNPIEPYFGIGTETLGSLTTPEGRTYSTYSEYEDHLRLIENGATDAYYNYYLSQRFFSSIGVERDLLGGRARVGAGLTAAHHWTTDYTGREVPGTPRLGSDDRDDVPMRQTKLHADYEAGEIRRQDGGWTNSVRIGLAYDTRDLEPNPRSGMFHDVFIVGSSTLLGSATNYTIATLATRFYYTPFTVPEIIFAARLAYSVKWGTVPFFVMNYMPTTDRHIYGLGGEGTLRGFRQSRFVAPVMAFGNAEARYVFARVTVAGQFIELMAVPFVDVGRVYNEVGATTLDRLKWSYGGGLRAAANQSFVLVCDFGFSAEDKGLFYLGLGHIF